MQPWKGHSPEADSDDVPTGSTADSAHAIPSSGVIQDASIEYAAVWPDDPFRRPDERSAASPAKSNMLPPRPTPGVRLQGILIVEGARICVLNGQSYAERALVNGWQIEKIGDNDVMMTRGESRVRLAL
jgi:hypothetical protein